MRRTLQGMPRQGALDGVGARVKRLQGFGIEELDLLGPVEGNRRRNPAEHVPGAVVHPDDPSAFIQRHDPAVRRVKDGFQLGLGGFRGQLDAHLLGDVVVYAKQTDGLSVSVAHGDPAAPDPGQAAVGAPVAYDLIVGVIRVGQVLFQVLPRCLQIFWNDDVLPFCREVAPLRRIKPEGLPELWAHVFMLWVL